MLEPIRTPGSIQGHGVLIALDLALTVTLASENCATVTDLPAEIVLGMSLEAAMGSEFVSAVRDVLDGSLWAANPILVERQGLSFDAIVHASDELVIIEFEPSLLDAERQQSPALYGSIHRLALATSIEKLRAETVRELRSLTQFDRIMIYHFHSDGHGEIVAEDVASGMEPYLGLHYPASDIPQQARALFTTKLSRAIVSSATDATVPLLALAGAQTGIDLVQSELRSASPHHLQFMRNMGQASTVSLSLVHDGELMGMITCAHRTERRIPYLLRRGLEILANQVSLQLSSMAEIERLTQQVAIRGIRATLVAQLVGAEHMAQALLHGETTVLDLIPADGVAVRLGGSVTSVGETPADDEIAALVEAVLARPDRSLVTDALPHEHPAIAALVPTVAGLLLLPLGGEGDYLACFRREVTQTVNWLGDLTLANRATPLSPRTSFSAWSHSVTGTSIPWDGLEAEAVELARDIDGALLRRAESQLAAIAFHDPLTGLPNRRLLMDRLDHALTKYARGEELALLFIDLDDFKGVNDAAGHDAGDALLVHVAQQITANTRTHDTVARLGGDEFVVLCEDTSAEEADTVALRVVAAIGRPVEIGGVATRTTASVGVAAANFSFSATELLAQADAAMYRAKARGRNQVSR